MLALGNRVQNPLVFQNFPCVEGKLTGYQIAASRRAGLNHPRRLTTWAGFRCEMGAEARIRPIVTAFRLDLSARCLRLARCSAALSPHPAHPLASPLRNEAGGLFIETDEKHAGDTMWVSSAATAELCNNGLSEADSTLCRVAYLARHAIGKDLDRGPRGDSVSLSDVADFCDSGAIDKSFALCERAYAVRHAAMT